MQKRLVIFLLRIFISTLTAQEQVRIMTYNILKYPSNIGASRDPHLNAVVSSIDPDIIVVQEMASSSGVNQFLNNVLDSRYLAGNFINGYDTDNALYYKDSLFIFLDNTPIDTDLRDINQFRLVHKIAGDTVYIYSAHLKASQGTEEENRRLAEVTELRNVTDQLKIGTYFMVVGDFNVYTSSEPAYQKLLDLSSTGYFKDPINKPGNWHSNSSYRTVHTQSTRTDHEPDGGSTGGLDDRFDFILTSQSILNKGGVEYIDGSYTNYGNDGSHLNKSLKDLPNSAVGDLLSLELYYSSDHLPVYADFKFEIITDVKDEIEFPNSFKLYQNYPNPFNPGTTIKYSIPSTSVISRNEMTRNLNDKKISPFGRNDNVNVTLKINDVLGREVATLVNREQAPGNYSVQFDANNLSSGVYFYSLKTDYFRNIKKMILLR